MPRVRVRVRIRSLLSTRDLLSKQRQLMQRFVQRLTVLEAIMDEQMNNENLFLSPELKCRRSLIEIIRRLKTVPPRKDFHTYTGTFNIVELLYLLLAPAVWDNEKRLCLR